MSEAFNPQDISTESRINPQKSFAEKEKINRDTINVVTTKISTALGTKFDQKDIPFDINTFKKNLNQSVEKIFSNPDIPDIAKEKFKQDILAKIDLLAQVTLGDIDILRTRRNIESVGMEAIEIKQKFGNDEAKIKAHYLGMILSETIGKYIQPTADGLMVAFSDKKESKGKNEYHGKTLESFSGSIQQLDTKYGLNMSAEIEKIANDFKRNTKGDISQEDLYRQVGIKIVDALNRVKRIPDANRVKQFIMNGNLTERSKGGKLTEAQVPNGSKDIVDIVMEYKEAIRTFQGTEREVRDARSTALSDGVGSKMKNALGMEGLKSEFDHLKSAEIEQRMKNASLADFVIMGTQLAQIAPIVGDIGGGTLDIGSAITGISSDGAKLSKVERAFSGIFGTLGLTVFLGWISRASKVGKMAGIISGLRLGAKYLPDKIGEFLKSGGKLSEQTKTALSSFGKMMGQEVSLKIEQMMLKNGGMVGFVEEGGKNARIGKVGNSVEQSSEYLKTISDAEKALQEAGLLGKTEHLTMAQGKAIFAGHKAGKPIGEQDFGSIRDKARASNGIPKEWKKLLMDKGIMGTMNEGKFLKIVDTEGKSDFEICRKLLSIYHYDKLAGTGSSSAEIEEISKVLTALNRRIRKGENVRIDLETLAIDPYAYLRGERIPKGKTHVPPKGEPEKAKTEEANNFREKNFSKEKTAEFVDNKSGIKYNGIFDVADIDLSTLKKLDDGKYFSQNHGLGIILRGDDGIQRFWAMREGAIMNHNDEFIILKNHKVIFNSEVITANMSAEDIMSAVMQAFPNNHSKVMSVYVTMMGRMSDVFIREAKTGRQTESSKYNHSYNSQSETPKQQDIHGSKDFSETKKDISLQEFLENKEFKGFGRQIYDSARNVDTLFRDIRWDTKIDNHRFIHENIFKSIQACGDMFVLRNPLGHHASDKEYMMRYIQDLSQKIQDTESYIRELQQSSDQSFNHPNYQKAWGILDESIQKLKEQQAQINKLVQQSN